MYTDAKEIYQLVLDDVKEQVAQIKENYGQQICAVIEEDVRKLYENRIVTLEDKNTSLKQQCTALKSKVDKLEQEIKERDKYQNYEEILKMKNNYTKQIAELKKEVKKLENEVEERNSGYSVQTRYDVHNHDLDTSEKMRKIVAMQVNQLYEHMEEQERRKNEPKDEPKPYWEELPGQYNCFITTAVCEYYGKEDDCEELTKLRHYRDTWLANEEGGKELIEEYYRCGPAIVKRIKTSENYAEYCETLMNTYISECLKMIDNGEFEDCKNKYIEMVNYANNLV